MASASDIRSGRAVVEIAADRAKLKADLAGAQQELNQFASSAKGGLGGDLGLAAGLGVEKVVVGAKTAVSALRLGWGLVKGDVDAVRDAIAALPLGIGSVAVALADLVSDMTGVTDEVKELADEWARTTKANTAFFVATLSLETITTDAQERSRQSKLEGDDLAIAKERVRVEELREQVRKGARGRGLGDNDPVVRKANDMLDQDLADATDKIRRKSAGDKGAAAFAEVSRLADDATDEWLKGLEDVADFEIDKVIEAQTAAMADFVETVRLAGDEVAAWYKGIEEGVDDAFSVAGEIEDLRARLSGGAGAAEFTTSRGTFSAREAATMGAVPAERLGKGIESVDRKMSTLIDVARKMGMTYTS